MRVPNANVLLVCLNVCLISALGQPTKYAGPPTVRPPDLPSTTAPPVDVGTTTNVLGLPSVAAAQPLAVMQPVQYAAIPMFAPGVVSMGSVSAGSTAIGVIPETGQTFQVTAPTGYHIDAILDDPVQDDPAPDPGRSVLASSPVQGTSYIRRP